MEERGPFDRLLNPDQPSAPRDRTAFIIVGLSILLGVVLLIVVLPPISILDGDEGGPLLPGQIGTTARDELPAPPPGFEAVSALLDLSVSAPVLRPNALTVPLSMTASDGETVTLFTYQGDDWRELGEAIVAGEGTVARGEVPFLPTNVAAFRATEFTHTVTGGLPSGAELDSRAEALLGSLRLSGLVPTPDGQLSGQLQLPQELSLPVVPTIDATTAADVDAVNAILPSADLRAAHVQAILDLANANSVAGIELNYRFDPALDQEFVIFAQDLSTGLASDGRSLGLVLPAPVRTGAGWDTFGVSWEALAPLAESLTITSTPEQDVYYARMEDVLGFLVAQAGSGKLLLSINTLSRERGVDGLRTLTLTEALSLASTPALEGDGAVETQSSVTAVGLNLGAAGGLRWDDAARAVAFDYDGPGGARTVWLSNYFSEAFKLDLARRFQLRGVAVEDVSSDTADANVWPVVAEYAQRGIVSLVEPNGDLLQPRWSASGGDLQSDSGGRVTWLAPAEAGDYTLTLLVSDGLVRVGQEVRVLVEASAGAAAP